MFSDEYHIFRVERQRGQYCSQWLLYSTHSTIKKKNVYKIKKNYQIWSFTVFKSIS